MAGSDGAGVADHADAGASFLGADAVRSEPRAVGRIQPDGWTARASISPATRAYAPFFRDVRQRLGPIDLALLPIGAYEPRWFMQAVHMNPAEAVQAHLDLGAPESIGMHFGTFQLTTEGIDEPLRALDDARRARTSRHHGSGHWVSGNQSGWRRRGDEPVLEPSPRTLSLFPAPRSSQLDLDEPRSLGRTPPER